MRPRTIRPAAFALAVLLAACGGPYADPEFPSSPPPGGAETLTFYVLGDWGAAGEGKKGRERQHAVGRLLADDLARLGPREHAPFVVGVGDNVYPDGIPRDASTEEVDRLLELCFGEPYRAARHESGPVVFHVVPGNHDYHGDVIRWESGGERRYPPYGDRPPHVLSYPHHHPKVEDTNDSHEYRRLHELRGSGPINLPQPLRLSSDRVQAIAIDTEGILRNYRDERKHRIEAHWAELERLLAEGDAPWRIVVGHHPVRSHGPHGGYRVRWLGFDWVGAQLKAIFGGDPQDLKHSANRKMVERLTTILREAHERDGSTVLYLSGHEHSLQLLQVEPGVVQLVSGSAGKTSPVRSGSDTIYSRSALGFARVDLTDSEAWITFLTVDGEDSPPFRIARR